ncbi:hypothetical protein HYH03_014655 [Edaphochlamys debaryana]|uniref:Uncharacterized protein n=1 Tax=Edaphochlamys debaryana TaxID=47281 RepID=A0A836BTD6_9CHLO|nr:hypothetical protein HYH03_014655 [Edaphochlamys debaryana]|eukprot:KAG2486729.1 hypothetical protein HYH03_014655 [Edaphochlamys debaryana]
MAKHRHQRVLLRQPRAASRYVLLLLGLLASRALAAPSCSRCPNTYDPVVDDATGKPFYNKCLAQCQLPANAKLSKTSKAGEPDFLQLMPTPAADALASAAEVTGDVINRFAEEGFFYVGRPGNGPDPKGSQGNASGNKTKDDNDSRSKTAKGSPSGTSALLRFTLPEGDMYIKVVTKKDEDELKAKYQGPEVEVTNPWYPYTAWSYDIGLLALAYHIPADSLGWLTNPPCWDTYYALSTAGYPGDKTDYSMWAQQIGFTTNVCQGDSNKNFFFDNGGGQSGS